MKWRKASELLPDENEPMVYRNSLTKKPIPYRKVSFSESFGNKWIRFYLTVSDITSMTVENVEWLDESASLPSSSTEEEKDLWLDLITEVEMNEFLSTKYKEVIDKLQSTYKISKR